IRPRWTRSRNDCGASPNGLRVARAGGAAAAAVLVGGRGSLIGRTAARRVRRAGAARVGCRDWRGAVRGGRAAVLPGLAVAAARGGGDQGVLRAPRGVGRSAD